MEFDILETKRITEIAKQMQRKLDNKIMDTYDLTYADCSGSSITLESKYHSVRISTWNMSATVHSKCDIEAKDVNTVEEFMAMKKTVKEDKEKLLKTLFYLAFIQFKGDM